MEYVVSLEDVANIVTFIAPGYFVIQVYSLIYAKKDRDFPRLLIESVVYSLPIVTVANMLWVHVFRQSEVSSLNIAYALLVLTTAVALGVIITVLRNKWPIKPLVQAFGVGSPHEDFIKSQFLRIQVNNPNKNVVTVKLKSGVVFSGTSDRISRYNHTGPSYYYFSNLAWYNEESNEWDERDGGVIVSNAEIEYIETPKLSNKY